MLFWIFFSLQQLINGILVGIGILFSGVIFHIGTKEPKDALPRRVCNATYVSRQLACLFHASVPLDPCCSVSNLWRIVLHCVVYYTLFYCAVLCWLNSTLLYSIVLFCVVLCCVLCVVLSCLVLSCLVLSCVSLFFQSFSTFYQLHVVIIYYNAPCHFITQKVSTLLTRHGLISAALTFTLGTNDEEHEEINGLSIFYNIYSTMFVFFQLFTISSRNQGSMLYCSCWCRCNGKRKKKSVRYSWSGTIWCWFPTLLSQNGRDVNPTWNPHYIRYLACDVTVVAIIGE